MGRGSLGQKSRNLVVRAHFSDCFRALGAELPGQR